MARRRFKGLTEIAGLDDAGVSDLVLGNWHKLNRVLMTRPETPELQRLLFLELRKGKRARGNFLERLRAAIAARRTRASRDALVAVHRALRDGDRPAADDLRDLGLDTDGVITLTKGR